MERGDWMILLIKPILDRFTEFYDNNYTSATCTVL